ncbi:MAG: hypothetical protein WAV07_17995 [Candidatus Contendobacter sp.]
MTISESGNKDRLPYGVEDASYRAAGGEAGIRKLVDDFYDAMDQLPEAAKMQPFTPPLTSLNLTGQDGDREPC